MGVEGAGGNQPATVHVTHRRALVRDAVMAGHRGDAGCATRLARDVDPAVRAAALGALQRLGALGVDTLVGALGDPDATVRRRACALAARDLGTDGGTEADAEAGTVVTALVGLLASDDGWVVEAAASALGEAGPGRGRPAVRSLERVAAHHSDPLCREAAVAALGAVGDPSALDTVLAALADKAAVRRRAAIALAAFDDPRVDEALRRCLDDRDWQVRQAAEELLDRP